jgi:hypothetical protein
MTKKIFFLSLVLTLTVVLSGCTTGLNGRRMSMEEAKVQTEQYINDNLMAPGSVATITSVGKEYGLYKMKVDIGGGQVIDSYTSPDGKWFFPQALEINPATDDTNTNTPATSVDLPKNDKPVVELFIMSHCPYGTQIEKGILPVANLLNNKIDFQLKFVDYAMHGEKEVKEQLNQYCIITEQNNKLNSYLSCFLEAGDGPSCLTKAGINQKKLNSCVAKADKEFKATASLNDPKKEGWKGDFPPVNFHAADNAKYSVGGSPTLIINGVEASSNRDSASLLTTICSAFSDAPDECQTELSSATPAPGFGTGTTDSKTDASCE